MYAPQRNGYHPQVANVPVIVVVTFFQDISVPESSFLQGLGALPKELVTRILKAGPKPPAEQIHLLPSTFRTAVVHAALESGWSTLQVPRRSQHLLAPYVCYKETQW